MAGRIEPADSPQAARWWRALPATATAGAALRCELCPRECTLHAGERGACRVRRNVDGVLRLTTYGRAARFRIGSVEQAPLYHFHPGSASLSFATAGCNLACVYCAHGDAVSAPAADRRTEAASADGIARAALAYGARLLSLDNDPVATAEYAIDVAIACRAHGLKTATATAGHIRPAAARELFAAFDAVNVGVKAFSESGYARLCGGQLQTVQETLCQLRFETRCWLEISYTLVPGYNDTAAEIGALASWIARELGADVPLHFSSLAFKTTANDAAAGSAARRDRLARARQQAIDCGLHYVYSGAARDSDGATTFCPQCQAALIERCGQTLTACDLTDDARCPYCQAPLAGYFGRLEQPRRAARAAVRLARR